jgi:hypothetical protein
VKATATRKETGKKVNLLAPEAPKAPKAPKSTTKKVAAK